MYLIFMFEFIVAIIDGCIFLWISKVQISYVLRRPPPVEKEFVWPIKHNQTISHRLNDITYYQCKLIFSKEWESYTKVQYCKEPSHRRSKVVILPRAARRAAAATRTPFGTHLPPTRSIPPPVNNQKHHINDQNHHHHQAINSRLRKGCLKDVRPSPLCW